MGYMVEIGPLDCVRVLRKGGDLLLAEKFLLLLCELHLGALEDASSVVWQDQSVLLRTLSTFNLFRLAQTCLMLGQHELMIAVSLCSWSNIIVLSVLRVQTVT